MKRLLVLLVLLLPQVSSQASERYNTTSEAHAAAKAAADAASMSTSSAIGGDQIISGGNTYAASHALGDVDIEGCIITKQWGSFIISHQYFVYDVFCLADRLDVHGKHDAAAIMRCSDKHTAKIYGDGCRATWTFKPAINPPMAVTPNQAVEREERDRDDDDDDDAYEALLKRVSKIEDEKAANVRRYDRDQVIVRKKEADRRAQAQSYLDRLPQQEEEPVQQEEICCLKQTEGPDNAN